MSEIEIINAKKIYHDVPVIENLNITIPKGSLFTLLGASGCGKTTLLRMIAGFNSIKDGEFYFDDTKINNMEPSKRNIGMVFQNYAIFPHLTVRDNVAFGLMQIAQYADRKPDKLSGGQQQRVTLACALAVNLSVLLMDEPLSNLEAKLRLDMRQAIREIQHEVGITTVYVTHDQEEAMAISDQIAVMKDGVIQQIGRPKELYHKPANEFVATFIGRTNIIPANLEKRSDGAYIVFSDGYALRMLALDQVEEQAIHVSIRPEEFIKDESGDIEGTISDSVYLGLNTEYFIETGFASKIQVSEESTFEEDLQKGNRIRLRINTQKLNIFSADGSQNLIKGVNHGT
ncbi:TPA: ABC transporter ATP-binding protein [Streptococcus pneumoniae]|uniref:ABC transporter ATP-binding protein n=1 Tax=Streptococcus pneumoniae TaxID=1313 RepID=UPI0007653353|nr:ABC transporter ATP-binding protein [Streptococcus pneumoniae]CVO70559.1 ATP-binding component of ABC transporter [Streptococcus pneumoniae]CWH07867.1 ATP-binding component of ABC transporter [Streptococcus pneumoniae]CWI48191.1 ATP-binding component of ABC transporter [Streptococcus pneumoniae]CWK90300.1 ATP-binding component of ABC transporter [Streptococcus pneumoniae]VKC83971.1 ATP-binding component of ABC transporter [Streptococcus pneumoniae]